MTIVSYLVSGVIFFTIFLLIASSRQTGFLRYLMFDDEEGKQVNILVVFLFIFFWPAMIGLSILLMPLLLLGFIANMYASIIRWFFSLFRRN